MKNLNQYLTIYKDVKQVLEFLTNGDKNDPTSMAMKNAISIEQIEKLKMIVDWCEDKGIHLLAKEVN